MESLDRNGWIPLIQEKIRAFKLNNVIEPGSAPNPLIRQTVEELEILLGEVCAAREEQERNKQEQQRAIADLQAERKRKAEFFDLSPDGCLLTDAKGVILEANRAAGAMLNTKPKYLLGKPFMVFTGLSGYRAFLKQLFQIRKQGISRLNNWQLTLMPREASPVQVSVSVVISEGGPNATLRWFLHEIEPCQHLGEVLAETPAACSVDTTADHIFMVDRGACEVALNPIALAEAGFTLENLLGEGPGLLQPEDAQFYQAQYRRAFESGGPVKFERGIRLPDGMHWCSVALAPMKDERGHIAALTGVSRNVTERRHFQEALKVSEEKFRSFVEQATEGMVLANEVGCIVEWNAAAEKLTGLDRSKAIGETLWNVAFNLIPRERRTPENYERMENSIVDILRSGRGRLPKLPYRRQILTPGGEIKTLHLQAFPIRTSRGIMVGCVMNDLGPVS